MRKNIMYMNRWDVIKKVRNQKEQLQRKVDLKRMFGKTWKIFMDTYYATKCIADQYVEVRNEEIRLLRQQAFGRMMVKRIQNYLELKGETRNDRSMKMVTLCLTAETAFVNDSCKARAEKTFKKFIFDTSE